MTAIAVFPRAERMPTVGPSLTVTYFARRRTARSVRPSVNGVAQWLTPTSQERVSPRRWRVSPPRLPICAGSPSRTGCFAKLCEEYALALESLARFEARPDAAERAEVGEYRTVIAELEHEIARFLKETTPGA
jgi:hypothetical protein